MQALAAPSTNFDFLLPFSLKSIVEFRFEMKLELVNLN